MLRAYQAHPGMFGDILKTVKDNLDKLPNNVREFYQTETEVKLKQRIREKIQRCTSSIGSIKDDEIR